MEWPVSEVFADAGYWIALINPREADRHLKARELSEEIAARHIQVVRYPRLKHGGLSLTRRR